MAKRKAAARGTPGVLTPRGIDSFRRDPKGHYDVFDLTVSGFGVRVAPSGNKTFFMAARFGGKSFTRRAIGKVGKISLAAAHAVAVDWVKIVKQGLDPAEVEAERARAAARKKRTTFASVAEDFISRKLPGERQGADVERMIRRELIEAAKWETIPITAITPQHVKDLIRAKVAADAPYRAHALLALCRRLFAWIINQGDYGLESSPCDRLKPRSLIGEKEPRQRKLSDDELRAFWRACGRLHDPYGALGKFLLLTGTRHREASEAKRGEFHRELMALIDQRRGGEPIDWRKVPVEWKLWTVPKERFKSNAEHMVPLSDAACEVLASLPRRPAGAYLFSTTLGAKPTDFGDKVKTKLDAHMLDALRPDQVELPQWQVHDLRRNVRTGLATLTQDHIAEMCLGHGRKGLARTYDQHKYADEIRKALDEWSRRVLTIVEPPQRAANVIDLHSDSNHAIGAASMRAAALVAATV